MSNVNSRIKNYAKHYEKKCKMLEKRNSELKNELSNALTIGGKAQAKRDLEMQAKGVEDFVSFCKKHKSISGIDKLMVHALYVDYAEKLRNQAKE